MSYKPPRWMAVLVLFAVCNTNNLASKAVQDNDSIATVQINDSTVSYNKYLAITAFTAFDDNIDPDWQEITNKDSIAIGVMNNDTMGLYGHSSLGQKWFCISFPNERDNKLFAADTLLSTLDYKINWYGDTITIVPNANKGNGHIVYDIAFRGGDKNEFKYAELNHIENSQLALLLTAKIQTAIEKRELSLYTDTNDIFIFEGLKEVNIDGKRFYLVSYHSLRKEIDEWAFNAQTTFLICGDKIYNWGVGFSTDTQLFQLAGISYIYHATSYYARFDVQLFKINDTELVACYFKSCYQYFLK